MKIEQVIFDLDGVLLDTTEGIVKSVRETVREAGFRELSYETLLKFVGPPVQESFIRYCGCTPGEAQNAAEAFREIYKGPALYEAAPYDGIYEACDRLKNLGIRMAVATYKREDYALDLLRHFGFDCYCDPMHGADNENRLKKADIVDLCRVEAGMERGQCVLVGDTDHDAVGARDAGIAFLGVTYGFGFKNEEDVNAFPNIGCAEKPLDIPDLVRTFSPDKNLSYGR